MAPTSTLLAAIHNGELARSPARSVIDALTSASEASEVVEIRDQSEINQPLSREQLWDWRRRQGKLERDWRHHISRSNPLVDLASLINQARFRILLAVSGAFRVEQSRNRQVEMAVTGKHLASWRNFLDSSHDTLIVLESDAAMTPRLFEAVGSMKRLLAADSPTYVNIAGGFDPEAIGIQSLFSESTEGFTRVDPAVTNTSCAYAVNREFAKRMCRFVEASPRVKELGVDWLINALFLDNTDTDAAVVCWHADPPALIHGSLAGLTKSWHPNR